MQLEEIIDQVQTVADTYPDARIAIPPQHASVIEGTISGMLDVIQTHIDDHITLDDFTLKPADQAFIQSWMVTLNEAAAAGDIEPALRSLMASSIQVVPDPHGDEIPSMDECSTGAHDPGCHAFSAMFWAGCFTGIECLTKYGNLNTWSGVWFGVCRDNGCDECICRKEFLSYAAIVALLALIALMIILAPPLATAGTAVINALARRKAILSGGIGED